MIRNSERKIGKQTRDTMAPADIAYGIGSSEIAYHIQLPALTLPQELISTFTTLVSIPSSPPTSTPTATPSPQTTTPDGDLATSELYITSITYFCIFFLLWWLMTRRERGRQRTRSESMESRESVDTLPLYRTASPSVGNLPAYEEVVEVERGTQGYGTMVVPPVYRCRDAV